MSVADLLRRLDRRLLPLLAAGLGRLAGSVAARVLVGGGVLVATIAALAAVQAEERGPVADESVGDVVRVGVAQGQSIPEYVVATRRELADLPAAPPSPAPVYALVTLSGYLAPDRLAPVLAGAAVSAVFARVPLPETQTEIVRIEALQLPDDVLAGMGAVALRKDREAVEYAELSAKLTGRDEQERMLRLRYASGARVATAEATAYRSNCSCVYAAVVRSDSAGLAALARRPGVRAVDPAPEVRRLDRAVFLPPLPEQVDVARPPADSAIGSPAPLPSRPGGGPPPSW